jgi:uncharacterized protein YoxC
MEDVMSGFEIAAVFGALAFAALVGALIPVLIEMKRAIAESGQLLARMNAELPTLIKEIRETTQNLNAVVEFTKDGVEHASVFLHAVGEVGETVHNVTDAVRSRNGLLASVIAGFKAATSAVKNRVRKGGDNGG